MADIAIVHTNLMAKGGGEGVCMRTLEALQDRHELTLLTLVDPDWADLGGYYDSAITDIAVRVAPAVERLFERTTLPLYNLRLAALNRFVRTCEADFDLIVGTDNELAIDSPNIQYIHTPRFGRLVTTKRVGEDSFVDHAYDRLSYRLGAYTADRIRNGVLLTNSRFMANVVQDAYGVRPRVVHPPIAADELVYAPWADRESGFLTIGRLTPYKNVETTIAIIDGLRDRGHDVHQHIIGPASDTAYGREIAECAASRPHVHLEGEVSRETLLEALARHRYGLHGKRNEHFGMAVAELAGSGAIPFVPDSGGQQEIVRYREELRYGSVADAVAKIDRVLANPERHAALRMDPDEIDRRFGERRFAETMRALVDDVLEKNR